MTVVFRGLVTLGAPMPGIDTAGLIELDAVCMAFDTALPVSTPAPDALLSMIASNSGSRPTVIVVFPPEVVGLGMQLVLPAIHM